MKLTGRDKNGAKVTYDLDLCDVHLEEVYDGITMITKDGNKMSVCMRDGVFEFSLKSGNSNHINYFKSEHTNDFYSNNNVVWVGDNRGKVSNYDQLISLSDLCESQNTFDTVEDSVNFEFDGEYLNFVNNRDGSKNNDPVFKTLEHVILNDGKEILVYNCKVSKSLPRKKRDDWAERECEKIAEKLELNEKQHLIFNLILDK